jgi:hypothetical protein
VSARMRASSAGWVAMVSRIAEVSADMTSD